MKPLLLFVGLALISTPALAQAIPPENAAAHIGQTVTVEGVATEVHTDDRSGVTFIDMGGRYPNHLFTGVIFSDSAGTFPNVHSIEGRAVDISGQVRLYKGKPEIILRSASQLIPK